MSDRKGRFLIRDSLYMSLLYLILSNNAALGRFPVEIKQFLHTKMTTYYFYFVKADEQNSVVPELNCGF